MTFSDRSTRISRTLVAMLAAALVIAACGGEDEEPDDAVADEEAPDAPDDDDEETDEAEAPEAADPDGIDRDATLRFQLFEIVENFDPDTLPSGYSLNAAFPGYDRLIHISPTEATLEPGLATEWERLEDGTVLRLYLREGVVFHDGTDFNAEAVEANIERSRTMGDVGRDDSTVAAETIGDIEVIDEYTIDLHMEEGQEIGWSIIESNLALPLGAMISPDAMDNPDLDRNPVGAGPFTWVDDQADRIIWERNEDYWDVDNVLVERLEHLFPSSPEAQLNAVISGESDISQLEMAQMNQAEAAGDLDVYAQSTLRMFKLAMNHDLEPLDDLNVRQAFLYGTDRDALQQLVVDGTGTPSPQFFPPDYFAYDPEHGEDVYAYDPERARELVESSEHWEGEPLDVEIHVFTTPEVRVRLAEAVQEQMAEVGINIEFTPVEAAVENEFLTGDKHIYLHVRGRVDPLQHIVQSTDVEFGITNPGGFTDDEFVAMLDEAAGMGAEERVDLVRELSGRQTENLYGGMGLFAESEGWGSRCVVGWQPPIAAAHSYVGVGIEEGCQL